MNIKYYVYKGAPLLHNTLLNYLFYGLCHSGVILKNLGQNSSFSVTTEVLTRGASPLIYVTKINKYRSLLRELIGKVCVFITNKNVRKQNLVAFLCKKKLECN